MSERSDDVMLTISKARERFGINRSRMTALIHDGTIPVYTNPRDKRSRMVKVADVERAMQPESAAPIVIQRKPRDAS